MQHQWAGAASAALAGELKYPRPRHAGRCDDRLRLLKAVTIFTPGGTEKQVHTLVRHLDHGRFDLQFACLRKYGHFLREVEDWGIPVREFRISSLYKPHFFRQQWRMARHLREQRIQIMHSYNFYSNVFAVPAARLAGVPVVLASIRDRGIYMSEGQKRLQRWVCRLADRVLVNAEAIRDWLVADGYDPARISVIRNGIDLSKFRDRGVGGGVREEFGIPAAAPVVVMLSRLNPLKGIEDFIKAAALVAPRFPDARFLVVGERLQDRNGSLRTDLDYHDKLRRMCEALGLGERVIFTGHRFDVPEVLARADVSVLPSHSEGLSNSLLESMAAGLPLVATRVGGNPELVREGENGWLCDVERPHEIAEAVARLLADRELARRFGAASRRRAEEEFSMDRIAAATQALYREEWRRRYGSELALPGDHR